MSETSATVGIDLIEIDRLEQALGRYSRLAGRIFTDGELRYAESRARPGRHLAARFAAKEAVVKALGIDGSLGLRDVEVVGSAPPRVRLSGRAAEAARAQRVDVEVSLTHSRELAAAIALARPAA